MKQSPWLILSILFFTQLAHAGISITSPSIASVYNVTTNQNFTVTCNATPNVSGTTINRVNFYYWRDGTGVPLCTPNYPTTNPTDCSVTGTGPTYTISNAKITAVPSNGGNDVVQCMGVVLNNINIGLPVGQELRVNVQAGGAQTAPTMPSAISATALSATSVRVNFTDASTNESSFTIQRATNSTFTTNLTTVTSSVGALSGSGTAGQYIDNTVLASQTYYYQIKAVNGSLSSGYRKMTTGVSTPAQTVTAPNGAPSSLTGSASTATNINLTWIDNASNEETFTLERSTNSGFPTGSSTVTVSPYINTIGGTGGSGLYGDNTVFASTTYYYRVKAVNTAGSSGYSNTATIATPAAQTVTSFPSNFNTKVSVTAYATVQANSITLKWGNIVGITHSNATIFRKTKAQTTWTQLTTNAANNQYVDSTAAVGTYYEYKIQIPNSSGATAYGYVASGIQVPVVENRGKLILLIDPAVASLSGMSGTYGRLATLRNDLKSEGWTLVEPTFSSTVASVKNAIATAYNADPTNVKSVFMIGHLPVLRSGLNFGPDGHGDHKGPWAADGYYADMTGNWNSTTSTLTDTVWTDSGTHTNNPNSYYFNYPNDGMKDQPNFPSPLELQIGRVDFYYMDEFSTSYGIAHDPVLYNSYFDRLHNYKAKTTVPQNRAFIQDNFGPMPGSSGYNFAATGFRNFPGLVGPSNVSSREGSSPTMFSTLNNQSYLFGYGCGSGGHLSAAGISTTSELADGNWGGVFNFTFGSYFGEWQSNNNNFLRAIITKGGLTNMWVGGTQGYFHHMGMGDPIGYSAQQTMNNKSSNIYYPESGGGTTSVGSYDNVELSLMGDPTLRLGVIAPPTNFAVNVSGNLLFSWTAPAGETGVSYIVYQVGANGGLTRVTPNPITTTTHQSTINNSVQNKNYIVKTYKLVTSQTGSYYNTSIGSNVVTR